MPPITFAHRGARLEAPDNSLDAFRRALDAGVSGLETDARLSADGEVVLAHDASVRRGLRRHRVSTTSTARLAELGVPRLSELYEELGVDFELSVDVKVPEAAAPIAAVGQRFGAADRIWLCSPDTDVVSSLLALRPCRVVHSTRKASLTAPMERHAAELSELGVDGMNMHHTDWTAGLVSLFHRFEVRAFAWDCQEVRHLRAMLAIRVDGLYCDRPARLVATVGEWVATSPGSGPDDSEETEA